MDIPYSIITGKCSDPCMVLEIHRVPELSLPPHIGIGISSFGQRTRKVAEHYKNIFFEEKQRFASFRYSMCLINKHAKEKGILKIQGDRLTKDYHIQGFIDFLKDNYEVIDMLSPHILERQGNEVPQENTIGTPPAGEMIDMPMPGDRVNTPNIQLGIPELDAIQLNGQGLDRLSADDLKQIKTLMLTQQFAEGKEIAQDPTVITDVEVKEGNNND